MTQHMKTRIALAGFTGAVIYFFGFLLLVFAPQALAATPAPGKTGFLVVAQNRGFLGDQELRAIMDEFTKGYPAGLALIGKDQPGVEDSYAGGHVPPRCK